jgi:GntR family transcriptional regulator
MGDRTVDSTSDRPVYKQIADILHEQIDAGTFVPGARLPSESELIERFGTARATVRRALGRLTNEGLVYSKRGVGVFVRQPPPAVMVTQRAKRLERRHRANGKGALKWEADRMGLDLDQEILALAEVAAPTTVAEHLGIEEGEMVFVRRRREWITTPSHLRVPTQLADSYLPLDIAQGRIREENTGPGGTYARIEQAGHRLTHFVEHLKFRMPTSDEARSLRIGLGIPVVDFVRVAHTMDRPVECFVAVMAGDKHRFEYIIPAN